MPSERSEEMAKYLHKYRIESTRLQGFDYTSAGSYFITICTKKRIPFLGQIIEGKMELSEMGKLAEKFWKEIPEHFPNAKLNEFIIMPDHMHGIICLSPASEKNESKKIHPKEMFHCKVSSIENKATQEEKKSMNQKMAAIIPKSGSISVIIRSYKSVVSKYCHKINKNFGWQERFHDRIIRNQQEFIRIALYIRKNPENYKK